MNKDFKSDDVLYIDNDKSLDEQKKDILEFANKYFKDIMLASNFPLIVQNNSNIFQYRLTMNNIGAFYA